MNNESNHPVIRKGKAGYYHAYSGNGWAVCARSRKEVKKKYAGMLALMDELIARPIPFLSEFEVIETNSNSQRT